jgi:hypothetical protein
MSQFLIRSALALLLAATVCDALAADTVTSPNPDQPSPKRVPGTRGAPAPTEPSKWLALPGDDVVSDPQARLGEAIYLRGEGLNGRLLSAAGAAGATLSGQGAACVQCHRRSGLGQVEGQLVVPPISGHALFQLQGGLTMMADTRSKKSWNSHHAPYDSASLARALRTGESIEGRALNAIMPRYDLDPEEQAGLEAYLRGLSQRWSPGITPRTITLATVFTPEIQGERRKAARDLISALVGRHNLATSPNRRHMAGATQFVLRTERQWIHRIWELQGAPDTWEAQLEAFQEREPAFALVSGVGRDWRPIDRFCARQGLPCWFPSSLLPAVDFAAGSRPDVSLHFSRGVLTEAEVVADALAQLPESGPPVREWHAAGDEVADAALQALTQRLAAAGRAAPSPAVLPGLALVQPGSSQGQLPVTPPGKLKAVARTREASAVEGSVLVCWCDAAVVRALMAAPPPARTVYVSGSLLAGATLQPARWLDPAPSAAWRAALRVVQPYASPVASAANLSTFHRWSEMVKLPIVDEALQSQVFFAFAYAGETFSEMLNNLHREYFVERGTVMLERREQLTAAAELRAAESLRSVVLRAPPSQDNGVATPMLNEMAHHEGTTVFPRLTLGVGQRFASRGAQILSIDDAGSAEGLTLATVGGWVVP